MTNAPSERNNSTPSDQTFEQAVGPLLTDLLYPSESDEPVEAIPCYLNQKEPLTVSQIKEWQMLPPSVFVEEKPESEFWAPVTTHEDWYGEDEKARTATFERLKQLLETRLTNRQFFRVGESEVDLYLLGCQADGERVGIKTKAVET